MTQAELQANVSTVDAAAPGKASQPAASPPVAEPPPASGSLATAAEYQWRIYAAINEWVRFADAKAGALLAANGVLAAAVIGALKDDRWDDYLLSHPVVLVPAVIGGIALLVSAFYCLLCILPKTDAGEARSLIFFEHIAERDLDAYRGAARAMGAEEAAYREISQQVWANARVAKTKHRQIVWAVRSLAVSLLCGLIVGVAASR